MSEEAIPDVRARFSAWARRPDVIAGLAVFVAMVLAGALRNTWIFTDGRIEDGDFAVNSILIDKAKHFQLLVGNYSRVGFNHPGPALLYVQAWGEMLFNDLLGVAPRPYNAQVLAILLLCAAMVGLSAAIVVRGTRETCGAALVLLSGLAIGVIQPGSMVSTSFPEIYIWSYFLLISAAAAVFAGRSAELPYFVLAGGLLCHGHVSFFLFTGGFALAIGLMIWRMPHERRPGRGVLTACAAVALLFAAPFVINLVLHWPGEVDDYWRYSRRPGTGGHSVESVVRFVAQYWSGADLMGGVVAMVLFAAACVLLTRCSNPGSRRLGLGLLATVLLSTVLLLVYAQRGVDDLSYRYVAEFYVTAPISVLLAIGLGLVDQARQWRFPAAAIWLAAALPMLVLFGMADMKARYPGANWIEEAELFLDAEVDRSTVRVMRFPLDVWPGVAGIVEQSRRTGDPVCIEEPAYGFLFDESMVCSERERNDGVVVQASPPRGADGSVGATQYDSPNIVLIVGPDNE